jgi:hypothetical protein
MDVKQIRDEITKIDSLLVQVESDIKKCAPIEVPREVMESEYMALLSALGSGSVRHTPFASLEDEPMAGESVGGLDAFTFFGLIQAFLDDGIVLSCLAKSLHAVVGVTCTQLEDSLVTIDRISDEGARREILLAVIDRIISDIDKIGPELIAICCQRLGSAFHASMLRLLELPGWELWPLYVQIEMAFYLHIHAEKSPLISRFVDCVVESAVGANGIQLERNTKLHTPRTAFQLLSLIRSNDNVRSVIPVATIFSFVERSAKSQVQHPVRQPSDIHRLCIELASWEPQDVTAPAWQAVAEKLGSSSIPVFEVAGTLRALERIRLVSDNLFSNILSVKKKIGSMTDRSELDELVSYLITVGDKSSGSAVTKFILEKREIFMEYSPLLAKIVELAAISSVESGTIIPEAILLFRKHHEDLKEHLGDKYYAVCQLLMPSQPVGTDFVMPPSPDSSMSKSRIQKCLETLGFSPDGLVLVSDYSVDGLEVDFAFPAHKTCIIIERESIFNVGTKRAGVCGFTAMKANIMAQRKSWKVIVVIPELYLDDKSLIGLLGEPLRRIPVNANLVFHSSESLNLTQNQRINVIETRTNSIVELARLFFAILRASVSVGSIVINDLVCGDHCISLALTEFLTTYVIKHKTDLTVRAERPGTVSVDVLAKLLDAMYHAGSSSGGFGIMDLQFGLPEETRTTVVQAWMESHPTSAMKLMDGAGPRTTDSSNVIFIS